jgi:cell division protein FtsB
MNWKNLWDRIQSLGFFFFISIVIAGAGLFLFLPVLRQRHAMQTKLHELDREIAKLDKTERQQRDEIDALNSDAAYVERIARDKLNLVRPGETFFRFEPAPAAPARTSPRR